MKSLRTTNPSGIDLKRIKGQSMPLLSSEYQDTKIRFHDGLGKASVPQSNNRCRGTSAKKGPVSNQRCFKDKRLCVPGDSHISPSAPDCQVA